MINVIRKSFGAALVFFDGLFQPKSLVSRSSERQKAVDKELSKLSLYHFPSCPFCIKVRRALKRLGLNLELRDASENSKDSKWRAQLEKEGGEIQTPCLRIEKDDGSVQWMYESDDIIKYLESRFSN